MAEALAPILRIENIHAGYGKKEILHGVSLALAPGEIVALIGPNGAGKSTLLKVVAGLLRPSQGHISYWGKDITAVPTFQRARSGIGYLIQGGAIFPSLTAEDHLLLGRRSALRGGRSPRNHFGRLPLPNDARRWRAAAGLFSGGERQALALATILASDPQLLLADEPSAGLSPAAASDLLASLAAASRERNVAVLWVEQRVAEVLPLANRAVLLRAGRVAAETSEPTQWLDGDTLSELMFREDS
ncbi:hypothetical protein EG19_10165 [Thermoanaerobaculum aquaticum]|uniref:ABC transporter domain-containing protein n=1 Tax=Thermoanaerobaculum aquaticum TaxID=1312852 RepID=A0A062XU13_9BACT|nr:ATP-binding cassette domain-containing protein [Thermoanaerobaculum aquaticum]KDA52839.1 hypothetical protein EG19_10165 [Thermoanaerobaculum aquaticum]